MSNSRLVEFGRTSSSGLGLKGLSDLFVDERPTHSNELFQPDKDEIEFLKQIALSTGQPVEISLIPELNLPKSEQKRIIGELVKKGIFSVKEKPSQRFYSYSGTSFWGIDLIREWYDSLKIKSMYQVIGAIAVFFLGDITGVYKYYFAIAIAAFLIGSCAYLSRGSEPRTTIRTLITRQCLRLLSISIVNWGVQAFKQMGWLGVQADGLVMLMVALMLLFNVSEAGNYLSQLGVPMPKSVNRFFKNLEKIINE